MSYITWTPPAVSSEARHWAGHAWRMVEAQHIAATMKIVDTAAEQDLLERLLEGSKPALPKDAADYDYLLASPFRYAPLRGGSRFRSVTDPGVFYGAQAVRTAAAELGYWRWRFLRDAVDLKKLDPVAHTAFRSDIAASVVDLREPPFSQDAAIWRHPTDYHATQAFAQAARDAKLGGIIYQSVRDPEPSWCIAVLGLQAFASRKPGPLMQTWWLAVQQDGVIWRREQASWHFAAERWPGLE